MDPLFLIPVVIVGGGFIFYWWAKRRREALNLKRRKSLRQNENGLFLWIEFDGSEASSPDDPSERFDREDEESMRKFRSGSEEPANLDDYDYNN